MSLHLRRRVPRRLPRPPWRAGVLVKHIGRRAYTDGVQPLATSAFFAIALVSLCVVLHYETLVLLERLSRRLGRHRWTTLITVHCLLFAHVGSPEIQCRFRWTPDALAFWDNRSVQHYAVADYVERRVMHRVTLVGDAPA